MSQCPLNQPTFSFIYYVAIFSGVNELISSCDDAFKSRQLDPCGVECRMPKQVLAVKRLEEEEEEEDGDAAHVAV